MPQNKGGKMHLAFLWVCNLGLFLILFTQKFIDVTQGKTPSITEGDKPWYGGSWHTNDSSRRPLALCRNPQPVIPRHDLAVAALHYDPAQKTHRDYYKEGAQGLIKSARMTSPSLFQHADWVLLTTVLEVSPTWGYWMPCLVEPEAPLLLTKLKAWQLIEYRAVLLLDLDTMVMGSLTPLFTLHLPQMLRSNQSVGGVSRSPCPSHFNTSSSPPLKTGALLLVPSLKAYLRMRKGALLSNTTLRAILSREEHYELPMRFHANAVWKVCNPTWWETTRPALIHFTVAKPWAFLAPLQQWLHLGSMHPLACWATGITELCGLWRAAWAFQGNTYSM